MDELVFGILPVVDDTPWRYFLVVNRELWVLSEDWKLKEKRPAVGIHLVVSHKEIYSIDLHSSEQDHVHLFRTIRNYGTAYIKDKMRSGYLASSSDTLHFINLPDMTIEPLYRFEGMDIVGFHEQSRLGNVVSVVLLTKSHIYNCYMLVEMNVASRDHVAVADADAEVAKVDVEIISTTKLFNSDIDFQFTFSDNHELVILTDAYLLVLYAEGKLEICGIDRTFDFIDSRACQLNVRKLRLDQYEIRAFMAPERRILKIKVSFHSSPVDIATITQEIKDTDNLYLLRYFGDGTKAIAGYRDKDIKILSTKKLKSINSFAPFQCNIQFRNRIIDVVALDTGKPSHNRVVTLGYDHQYSPHLMLMDSYNPGYINFSSPDIFGPYDSIEDFWPTNKLGVVVKNEKGLYVSGTLLDRNPNVFSITNEGYFIEDSGDILGVIPSTTTKAIEKSYIIHKFPNIVERIEIDENGTLQETKIRNIDGLDGDCTVIKDELNIYYYRKNTLYVIREFATSGDKIAKLPVSCQIYDCVMGTPAGSRVLISDIMGCLYLFDFGTNAILKKLYSKNKLPFKLLTVDTQSTYVLAYNNHETVFVDLLENVLYFVDIKLGHQEVKVSREIEAGNLWFLDSNNFINKLTIKMENSISELSSAAEPCMAEKLVINLHSIPDSIIYLYHNSEYIVLSEKSEKNIKLSVANISTGSYEGSSAIEVQEEILCCKLFSLNSTSPEFQPFEMLKYKNLFIVAITTSKGTILYLFELLWKENSLKKHSINVLKNPITDIVSTPEKIHAYLFQDLQQSFIVEQLGDGKFKLTEIFEVDDYNLERKDYFGIPIFPDMDITAHMRSNVLILPEVCQKFVFSDIVANRLWTYSHCSAPNAVNFIMIKSAEFFVGMMKHSGNLKICIKDGDYYDYIDIESAHIIESIKPINPYSGFPLCYSYMDNGQSLFLLIFEDGYFGILEVIENREDLWRGFIEDVTKAGSYQSANLKYSFRIKRITTRAPSTEKLTP
ncbi:uncharacterized protein RNJ42_02344 [Nakaseomyces bracarensis]|uniref:uncharacterized protein n=1 Tax=Nakaseomyces bracarensis TaxID=273131 RepID=UPI00387268E7